MTKYKALYKGIYDDLKDAEMMIDYAIKICKEGDKPIADEIAKYAQYRLQHSLEFHKLLVQEITKEKKEEKETVHECMWNETHKTLQEWREDIEKKIKSY
jgi:hypothetical protein